MRQFVINSGYAVVRLRQVSEDGSSRRKAVLVHRAVMLAYAPHAKSAELDVNHRDGNRLNNGRKNLEWATRSENHIHAHRVLGRKPVCLGVRLEKHPRARAVVGADPVSGEVVVRYPCARSAVKDGYRPSGICSSAKGHKKTHNGLVWSYADDQQKGD